MNAVPSTEQLAGQILDTLDRLAIFGRDGPKSWDRQRELYRELHAMRRRLAVEFGDRYGWRLSKRKFLLRKLGPRSVDDRHRGSWNSCFDVDRGFIDHAYYFRHPQRPYQPLGVAVDLFENFNCRIEALADRLGVIAEPVSDFPSWWFPGVTTLAAYRR